MASTTTSTVPDTNIVCFCPYCNTGYEWLVNCDCLEEDDAQEQEQQQQQEQQDDTQEQQQQQDDNDSVVYDLVECEHCGNKWDGFAQCMCWGNLNSDPFYHDNLTLDQHGYDINEND